MARTALKPFLLEYAPRPTIFASMGGFKDLRTGYDEIGHSPIKDQTEIDIMMFTDSMDLSFGISCLQSPMAILLDDHRMIRCEQHVHMMQIN